MHTDIPRFVGLLAVMLASAKLCGALARRIGQPAVLGELVAGVLLGSSIFGIVDSNNDFLNLLSETGVVILLFEIGLETDLRKLLKSGGSSVVVAVVGVVLPFALGYLVCELLEMGHLVALVSGATLTATSVGITARVLSDLNRLHETEGQIILGAAVVDDVIGLVILSVVASMIEGKEVTALSIAKITLMAFGFLVRYVTHWLVCFPGLGAMDLPCRCTGIANYGSIGGGVRIGMAGNHGGFGHDFGRLRRGTFAARNPGSSQYGTRGFLCGALLRTAVFCNRWGGSRRACAEPIGFRQLANTMGCRFVRCCGRDRKIRGWVRALLVQCQQERCRRGDDSAR